MSYRISHNDLRRRDIPGAAFSAFCGSNEQLARKSVARHTQKSEKLLKNSGKTKKNEDFAISVFLFGVFIT